MQAIARFVTRLQGEGDGLFIGALFKNGEHLLDPNSIYEIRDVLGTLTIVKVGEATGSNANPRSPVRVRDDGIAFHWASGIEHVLARAGELFLTREELAQHRASLAERYKDL